MKKVFSLLTIVMAIMLLMSGFALAQEKPATPAQAKALLQKAVALTKELGCEKAIVEFNKPNGPMCCSYSNAYASLTKVDGVVLGHGKFPYLVSKNLIDVKDAEGKPFLRTGLNDVAKKGKASCAYKWQDPKTKKIETRNMMAEAFNCGAPHGVVSIGVTYEGEM